MKAVTAYKGKLYPVDIQLLKTGSKGGKLIIESSLSAKTNSDWGKILRDRSSVGGTLRIHGELPHIGFSKLDLALLTALSGKWVEGFTYYGALRSMGTGLIEGTEGSVSAMLWAEEMGLTLVAPPFEGASENTLLISDISGIWNLDSLPAGSWKYKRDSTGILPQNNLVFKVYGSLPDLARTWLKNIRSPENPVPIMEKYSHSKLPFPSRMIPLRAPHSTISHRSMFGPLGEWELSQGGILVLEDLNTFKPDVRREILKRAGTEDAPMIFYSERGLRNRVTFPGEVLLDQREGWFVKDKEVIDVQDLDSDSFIIRYKLRKQSRILLGTEIEGGKFIDEESYALHSTFEEAEAYAAPTGIDIHK